MNSGPDGFDVLADCLYRLDRVKHIQGDKRSVQSSSDEGCTLLLMLEASGDMIIEEESYTLHRDTVWWIMPDTEWGIQLPQGTSIEYYHIQFRVLQAIDGCYGTPPVLPSSKALAVKPIPYWRDTAVNIERMLRSGDRWDKLKAGALFQELMATLLKEASQTQKPSLQQTIELARQYIEQHYHESITRSELAQMIGMSEDHCTRIFKKFVGQSPIEYLTNIRIRQAKKAMVLSDDPLRSVAMSVGFRDEFYFSRQFKAKTGLAPTAYISKVRHSYRIASLKHLVTGHLLALGIKPYAAVLNAAYPVSEACKQTMSIGEFKPDLEKLLNVKPDLIVTASFSDAAHPQLDKVRLFDHIAPTIMLPRFQDWREHFRTVARLVGEEEKAELWLKSYEVKVRNVRDRLHRMIGDDTCLIIGIGRRKLCIYGQRNVGTVLYHDLGLCMPKGVESIEHYREVTLEELQHFDADRIVLTCYRHDGTLETDRAIEARIQSMYAHPQWRKLKATRNQAIYPLYEGRHLYTCYSAYSHDLLLDQVDTLMMSDLSK